MTRVSGASTEMFGGVAGRLLVSIDGGLGDEVKTDDLIASVEDLLRGVSWVSCEKPSFALAFSALLLSSAEVDPPVPPVPALFKESASRDGFFLKALLNLSTGL